MKPIFLLYLFFLLFSCPLNKEVGSIKNYQTPFFDVKELSKPVKFPNGNFYKFVFISDKKYKIEWGNNHFKNVSKETFEVLGNGALKMETFDNEFIILKQGCGQKCHYAVVLPLYEKRKESIYEEVVKIDIENRVIVCMSDDNEFFIVFKNFVNNKEMKIKEKDLCPAANPIECIDSCYFKGSYFFIYWQGSKWESKKPDNKMRKIEIPQ